ncbi:MAG: hypothetical protein C0614_01170 [Desulfuromonas sp.]|nr:MAG: hypothetical protein C0614_01170 [Desulfuromonas sp.]
MAKARQAGCDEVLAKPLDRLKFLQVGRQFLSSIREHRHPCFFNLRIDFDGQQITGKCLDISGGGMFLETKEEIPVGTFFDLSFKLPDARSTSIRCRAEVKWLNRRPNPMKPHYPQGVGLSFLEIDVSAQKAIMLHTQKR